MKQKSRAVIKLSLGPPKLIHQARSLKTANFGGFFVIHHRLRLILDKSGVNKYRLGINVAMFLAKHELGAWWDT